MSHCACDVMMWSLAGPSAPLGVPLGRTWSGATTCASASVTQTQPPPLPMLLAPCSWPHALGSFACLARAAQAGVARPVRKSLRCIQNQYPLLRCLGRFGKPPVDPEGRRDRDDGGGRYAGGRDGGRDGGEGAFRDRGDRPPMPRGGTWGDVMERDGERDRAPRRQQRSSPSPPPNSDWKLKAGGVYVR